MSIKVILFDLDGTLLPMDQDIFVKDYFSRLAKKLSLHGYEPEKLISSMWLGVKAMVKNDGARLNEAVFWETFYGIYADKAKNDMPVFEEFYKRDFADVQASCGYTPKASELISKCKELGLRVALATNPVFPAVATEHRISWAGLKREDFELVTTYENSRYCKPNPLYYKDVIEKLGAKPSECLMVGNDVRDDMVAEALGAKVFLLTDCLINGAGKDISAYPRGSFDELYEFIKANA